MADGNEGARQTDAPGGERFDELLDRLRKLVGKLESGTLSLEDSLRCFEEGVLLCKRGTEILDGAERRVEILLARPGGRLDTAPLDDPGADAPRPDER